MIKQGKCSIFDYLIRKSPDSKYKVTIKYYKHPLSRGRKTIIVQNLENGMIHLKSKRNDNLNYIYNGVINRSHPSGRNLIVAEGIKIKYYE